MEKTIRTNVSIGVDDAGLLEICQDNEVVYINLIKDGSPRVVTTVCSLDTKNFTLLAKEFLKEIDT